MAEPVKQGLRQDQIVDQPKQEAMQMSQADGVDAVNALAASDTASFKAAIQNMLNNKVADYLDVKKLDVAQNFLKVKDSEEETEVEDDDQPKEKENVEV